MEKDILVCPNCGSENMEWKCWVKVNTPEITEGAVYGDTDYWCPDCETHQLPINKEEFINNGKE
jgi:Zn finger protein HypA/HybF involved in hydrogenase expression